MSDLLFSDNSNASILQALITSEISCLNKNSSVCVP